MKQNRYLVLILVGIVLVAGVVFLVNRPQAQQESEPILATDEEIQATETLTSPTQTSEIAQNPTVTVQENTPTTTIPPTPRTEMEGTDPTTVNLASGDVQLVEIFAFW